MSNIQGLSSQDGNFSQFYDLFLTFDFYFFLKFGFLLFFGNGSKVIVRFYDMLRDNSFLRDDSWSQGSGELKSLISFFLDLLSRYVDEFMDSPGLFEALLAAEVGEIEIHLFAGGTHHSGFLAAAWSPT
jgi:hypothetical protein